MQREDSFRMSYCTYLPTYLQVSRGSMTGHRRNSLGGGLPTSPSRYRGVGSNGRGAVSRTNSNGSRAGSSGGLNGGSNVQYVPVQTREDMTSGEIEIV